MNDVRNATNNDVRNMEEKMNELDKLLAEVDKIEDDEKWLETERDTVQQYCENKNFEMTEDEMETIRSRELEDFFYYWKYDWEDNKLQGE